MICSDVILYLTSDTYGSFNRATIRLLLHSFSALATLGTRQLVTAKQCRGQQRLECIQPKRGICEDGSRNADQGVAVYRYQQGLYCQSAVRLWDTMTYTSLQYSPTYPAKLVVPSRISDAVLAYSSKYRSKARIPALSYLHWANHVSQSLPARVLKLNEFASRHPSRGVVSRLSD